MIAEFHGPYLFLSNFFPATVQLDGIPYPSVEHAYQTAKTLDPQNGRPAMPCWLKVTSVVIRTGGCVEASERITWESCWCRWGRKSPRHGTRDATLALAKGDLLAGLPAGERP